LSLEPPDSAPPSPSSAGAPRRPRADAARNRATILAAARDAFADAGPEPSLEGIARAAGVGIGTLYRHFPTRQDLIVAVYSNELDAVLATVEPLLANHEPDVALREFMRNYAGFIATKRGMAQSLQAAGDRAAAPSINTRNRVNAAMGTILAAGAERGVLRSDVPADDVTAGMIGIFLSTASSADDEQIVRLLDLLVRGLRPSTTGGSAPSRPDW